MSLDVNLLEDNTINWDSWTSESNVYLSLIKGFSADNQ